jgi:hypothetical protein
LRSSSAPVLLLLFRRAHCMIVDAGVVPLNVNFEVNRVEQQADGGPASPGVWLSEQQYAVQTLRLDHTDTVYCTMLDLNYDSNQWPFMFSRSTGRCMCA